MGGHYEAYEPRESMNVTHHYAIGFNRPVRGMWEETTATGRNLSDNGLESAVDARDHSLDLNPVGPAPSRRDNTFESAPMVEAAFIVVGLVVIGLAVLAMLF